jgi:hypothetical protein
MTRVRIFERTGDFAEDKDAAASLRENIIRPAISVKEQVLLNFEGVSLATQSFVHALISDLLRTGGEEVLERLEFKGCAPGVRGIIETVVQYSLDTGDE